jgi:hypothetical protein
MLNRIRSVRWVGLLMTFAMSLPAAVVVGLAPAVPARADEIVIPQGIVCVQVSVAGVQSACQPGIPVGPGQATVAQVVPPDYGPTLDIRGTELPTLPANAAAAWTPFFTEALEKIAQQRQITPDQRNLAFGVPEARALLVNHMFEIIHKHDAGETLTPQEATAYDALSATVHHERQATAAKEMEDYEGVTANPCGLQNLDTGEWITNPWPAPVGDPLSYYKSIEPACRSIWNGLASEYPLPTIEQFREWGRDQVMEDHFSMWADGKDPEETDPLNSQLLAITNPIELNSPFLTHEEAMAEAKLEFEHAIGSLPQGFAFLTATRAELEETPAEGLTEAEDELLAEIQEAAAEFGAERFQESISDVTATLTESLWDMEGVEYSAAEAGTQAALEAVIEENLSGLFEAGINAGAAIGGATAALIIDVAFLVSQSEVRDALQADVDKGAQTPDLDEMATTEEGRQELITDLIISVLPDNNVWRMLAPSSFAPAADANDLAFDVAAAGETSDVRRVKTLAIRDWVLPGGSWLYSTSDGWMTKGHIQDLVGTTPQDFLPGRGDASLSPRRYTPVINFVDWDGAYWRAWLQGDTFVQAKYADRVPGTVQVVKSVQGLADGPCPPGSSFGVEHAASVLGPSCVLGSGTHFTQDLHKGDTVQIAGQLKTVQFIYSDTALTTTVPFNAEMAPGQEMVHVLPLEPTCFDTGQCLTSPTIHFQTDLDGVIGLWSATLTGNHSPTVNTTISTLLTPAFLAGNLDAPAYAIGMGRPVTFFATAADPDPGDHVSMNFVACQPTGCEAGLINPLPADHPQTVAFPVTFRSAGRQTVRVDVYDDDGHTTTQTIAVTVVPTVPQWKSATLPAFVVGQPVNTAIATEPGQPTPSISLSGGITLPAGLSLTDNHDGTATISGTPAPGTAGTYPMTLLAQASVTYPMPDGTLSGTLINIPFDASISVRRQSQTITPDAPTHAVYGSAVTVNPTSSSGLPVTVTASSTSAGVCSAGGSTGHTLTLKAVGECALVMHQAGDGTFDPATDATASFNVEPKQATATIADAAQYSDPGTFNTVGSTTGLVGTDVLAGSVTGCTGVGLTVTGGVITSPAGAYPATGCHGLSNPNYVVGYAGGFTVSPEDATLAYNGDWLTSTGAATATTGTATLRAILTQAADGHPGDLTKANVDFRLFKSTNTSTTPDYTVSNVAVSAAGDATASITLPVDTYVVELRVSNTDWFVAPRAIDELTIYQPASNTSANAGGWVVDPGASGNQHGHFGIAVATKKGTPSGHLTYSWRDAANGYNYVLRSNSWQGGDANITATQATLAGKASLTAYDASTGLAVAGIGGGNYTFLVKAVGGTSGGAPDTYSIVIRDPQAVVVHTVAQTPIGGGHITLHP